MGKSDDLKSIENIVIKIQKLDKQIEFLSIRLKNALGINKNNSSNSINNQGCTGNRLHMEIHLFGFDFFLSKILITLNQWGF
jgi:hypothetical protein